MSSLFWIWTSSSLCFRSSKNKTSLCLMILRTSIKSRKKINTLRSEYQLIMISSNITKTKIRIKIRIKNKISNKLNLSNNSRKRQDYWARYRRFSKKKKRKSIRTVLLCTFMAVASYRCHQEATRTTPDNGPMNLKCLFSVSITDQHLNISFQAVQMTVSKLYCISLPIVNNFMESSLRTSY